MQTNFAMYTETVSAIAMMAGCTPNYVREQAAEGRVPCIRASNGMLLYPREAADVVRRLKAEGLARRGAVKRKPVTA